MNTSHIFSSLFSWAFPQNVAAITPLTPETVTAATAAIKTDAVSKGYISLEAALVAAKLPEITLSQLEETQQHLLQELDRIFEKPERLLRWGQWEKAQGLFKDLLLIGKQINLLVKANREKLPSQEKTIVNYQKKRHEIAAEILALQEKFTCFSKKNKKPLSIKLPKLSDENALKLLEKKDFKTALRDYLYRFKLKTLKELPKTLTDSAGQYLAEEMYNFGDAAADSIEFVKNSGNALYGRLEKFLSIGSVSALSVLALRILAKTNMLSKPISYLAPEVSSIIEPTEKLFMLLTDSINPLSFSGLTVIGYLSFVGSTLTTSKKIEAPSTKQISYSVPKAGRFLFNISAVTTAAMFTISGSMYASSIVSSGLHAIMFGGAAKAAQLTYREMAFNYAAKGAFELGKRTTLLTLAVSTAQQLPKLYPENIITQVLTLSRSFKQKDKAIERAPQKLEETPEERQASLSGTTNIEPFLEEPQKRPEEERKQMLSWTTNIEDFLGGPQKFPEKERQPSLRHEYRELLKRLNIKLRETPESQNEKIRDLVVPIKKILAHELHSNVAQLSDDQLDAYENKLNEYKKEFLELDQKLTNSLSVQNKLEEDLQKSPQEKRVSSLKWTTNLKDFYGD